ncbi:MAG: RDD family protein [Saprospiraceae bacterium]|nr:MAG: RDD domain-containing protein [Bacteroidetes bacterium OLB9]MCO6462817.1 RDD family protein [Saprospiraceae bacterium]MCZ2336739.1 RDD family protein [Chitinophagales bacterium]
MAEVSVNTTQNVNINFTLADVGQRAMAYLVDLMIKGIYLYIVFLKILIPNEADFLFTDFWSVEAMVMIFSLPLMLYSLVQEYFMNGQTIGKKLLGLKVIALNGRQPTFTEYLIRWLFRPIDMSISFYAVGILSIMLSVKRQRLGDIAAGTAIISLRNTISIDNTILQELAQDYQPRYPEVVRFSDNDIRIIKELFEKIQRKRDLKMLDKLVEKVETVSGIKRMEQPEKFIDTVIKDYNYYTGQ